MKRPSEAEQLAFGLWQDVVAIHQAAITSPALMRAYIGTLHEASEKLNRIIEELEHGTTNR